MATITKRDLVVRISNDSGKTQQEVFDIVQKFLDTVTTCLANNDEVVLRNFGAFQVKETKAKVGRNPNDPKVDVKIPPRAVVKFKPGKEMKEKVATLLPELQVPHTPPAAPPSAD
ncbi:MAG: HU family DNA-binding protein [Verrucomicrobiales bacterium]